jgi:hypothetical protein
MLGGVALLRRDVSEEQSASIIKVRIIGEIGKTLRVTRNRPTLIVTSQKTAFFQ